MLQAALEYKEKCEFKAENWETKRQKYKDIFDILRKEYPDEKEKHPTKEKMNKERVAAKLKSIRSVFKKVIDCGKKSDEGRVIFTFFNFCNDFLSGYRDSLLLTNAHKHTHILNCRGGQILIFRKFSHIHAHTQ